ncbi:hypothetical protein OE88DRAFT_1730434 [Heliocybe sulcata]|uniref:Retrotransposon gag domain-containing protein n=1 Tax=Heliocybe sulcata TaxID=5364 RepID=A0A5C3NKK5_9AGAM|nr:hypothetical protein OE88DRAFT_1730434 [Heliocybe sulcata]
MRRCAPQKRRKGERVFIWHELKDWLVSKYDSPLRVQSLHSVIRDTNFKGDIAEYCERFWSLKPQLPEHKKTSADRHALSPNFPMYFAARMDRLSSLGRFKGMCPYLGRTKQSTLRSLCTSTSPRYPVLNRLTEKATQCPVLGPVLYTPNAKTKLSYNSSSDSTSPFTYPSQDRAPAATAPIAPLPSDEPDPNAMDLELTI